MAKLQSQRQILDQVATSQAFTELEQLRGESTWGTMPNDERESLALLLVLQGEDQLRRGDAAVLDTFSLASKVAPWCHDVFYRQAMAYSVLPHNVKCWGFAVEALEKATLLAPQSLDAWSAKGKALLQLGNFHQDNQYFADAEQCFAKAVTLSPGDKKARWLWQCGRCWYHMGKLSGEAQDFRSAVDRYNEAAFWGLSEAIFWNDYGNALAEFGTLSNRHELLCDAIELYRKAIASEQLQFEPWINCACTYQVLFDATGGDDLFASAYECFNTASELRSEDVVVWIKWGMLLSRGGQQWRDKGFLEESVEKFERANECEPNHAEIIGRWGEAEMCIGAFTDSLEHLRNGEQKIMRSLELAPEMHELWYMHGCCQNELGRYFGEERYYQQAIEKFRRGLAIKPDAPILWHGIAVSMVATAELKRDALMMLQGIQYLHKAIESGGAENPMLWNEWGAALMKLGELSNDRTHLEEALEKFEKAIQLQSGAPTDFTGVDTEILYNYGCAFDFLGDFTESETFYERAVQVLTHVVQADPDYVYARYNLALAWSHLGEVTTEVDCFAKAIENFQVVIAHEKEDDDCWNEWGVALIHLAQLMNDPCHPNVTEKLLEQAEAKLNHALTLGNGQAAYHLACLYSLIGHQESALHYLERADRSGSLPALDDLMHDEWLEGVRNSPGFRQFAANLERKK